MTGISFFLSWCFTSTETIRLITDGGRWGKREIIYLSLHCYHQNDSYIEVGRNESRFNVLLIVRDKVKRQCPQPTTFSKRRERRSGFEPKPFFLTILTPYRWAKPAHPPEFPARDNEVLKNNNKKTKKKTKQTDSCFTANSFHHKLEVILFLTKLTPSLP